MDTTPATATTRPSASPDPRDREAAHDPEPVASEPAPRRRPRLPPRRKEASGGDGSALLSALHRFCLGEPRSGGTPLVAPDSAWLPAALYPFRHAGAVRQPFPLILAREGGTPQCLPLADFLRRAAETFAPNRDDARILTDNLVRLEIEVRAVSDAEPRPLSSALDVIARACDSLESKLALKGEAAGTLHADLARLRQALPPDALLLRMDPSASTRIYLHAAALAARGRYKTLRDRATDTRRRLRDLLATERSKSAAGQSPEVLAGTVASPGMEHLDPGALSRVLESLRRDAPADDARINRVERVLETIDSYLAQPQRTQVQIVSRDEPLRDTDPDTFTWHAPSNAPCAVACEVFYGLAVEHAPLFAALRAGDLELAGAYNPAVHDAMAESIDWRAFSREELLLLPPVLAIERPDDLAGTALLQLSRLLLSGRPIDVLVEVPVAGDPGAEPADLLRRYRLELAYLGVSHREALVNQTTAARPEHLLDSFVRGLNATHASLHVVMSALTGSGNAPRLGSWLHGGAALEARGHPLLHYDPGAGDTWAKRLDFSANPTPDEDWPSFELECEDASGAGATLAGHFTFADFCLLEEAYHGHFRVVPDTLESDALVPAAEYFRLDPDEVEKIPYIWAADGEGALHRVVFTRRLAFACRDRLDFWHTLQELSGVRNEHVREAVQRERARLETEFAAERARLEAEHQAETERVRREAAGEALRRLAESLVSADLSAQTAGAAPRAATRPAAPTIAEAPPPAEAAPEAAPPAVAEEAGFEEPWVDTALCTSCNDCTNLNPRVFVYNANKQVVIGDPRAGTFAEIVHAAEKCPARCIHPGKPLDPAEPGLAELVERAKPFN